jgi:hypothetical protein
MVSKYLFKAIRRAGVHPAEREQERVGEHPEQ